MANYRKRYYLGHPRVAWREFVYWPIKNGWQLAHRGWADSDTWGLDYALCRRLGAQLMHLAETVHGWPDQKYDTPEEWTEALRKNGQALTNYAVKPGHNEVLKEWHDLKFGKDPIDNWLGKINSKNDAATEAAWLELRGMDNRYYDEAQAALYWVADHFGHLWD